MVIFPQQTGRLLNFLLSNNIQFYDIIRVIWLYRHPHTKDNLQYFSYFRKTKFFKALLWLKANNSLYENNVINFDLIDTCKRDFILARIANSVFQYDKDIHEREDYIIDLDVDKFDNNLHHAINNIKISDFDLLSICLYIDIDDTCKRFIIKFVLAITNHKNKLNNNYTDSLIFTYQNRGRIIFLNDWENPEYFMTSFSTIFLVLEVIYL